jgi:hypothetical protein
MRKCGLIRLAPEGLRARTARMGGSATRASYVTRTGLDAVNVLGPVFS